MIGGGKGREETRVELWETARDTVPGQVWATQCIVDCRVHINTIGMIPNVTVIALNCPFFQVHSSWHSLQGHLITSVSGPGLDSTSHAKRISSLDRHDCLVFRCLNVFEKCRAYMKDTCWLERKFGRSRTLYLVINRVATDFFLDSG